MGCTPLFFLFCPDLKQEQELAIDKDYYYYYSLRITLGAITGFVGIFLQFIADNALFHYRKVKVNKKNVLDTGIWGIVRFPNYLGEQLFWIGVALIGRGCGAPVWTCCGAVSMILLFVFVSIPMKDQRMMCREGYSTYKDSTPALLPFGWGMNFTLVMACLFILFYDF